MTVDSSQPGRCPACRTRHVVAIHYGPTGQEEAAAAATSSLWLGGAETYEPAWHCLRCGHEWPGEQPPLTRRRIEGPTVHGGAYAIETVIERPGVRFGDSTFFMRNTVEFDADGNMVANFLDALDGSFQEGLVVGTEPAPHSRPRRSPPRRVIEVKAALGSPVPNHEVVLDRLEIYRTHMELHGWLVPGLTIEEEADAGPFDFIWECEVRDDRGGAYEDRGGGYGRLGGDRSPVDRDIYPAPRRAARVLTVIARTPNGETETGRVEVPIPLRPISG